MCPCTWSFSLAQSHFYILSFLSLVLFTSEDTVIHHIASNLPLSLITSQPQYALSNLRLCLCKPFTTIDLCNTINSYVYSGATKPTLFNIIVHVINVHNSTLLYGSSVDTLQVITSCLQVMYRLPLARYCVV